MYNYTQIYIAYIYIFHIYGQAQLLHSSYPEISWASSSEDEKMLPAGQKIKTPNGSFLHSTL